MQTDLESALVASLPGAPTALLDYKRASVALDRVGRAVTYLQSARAELSVIAGEQRVGVRRSDEAILAAQQLYADLETVIRAQVRMLETMLVRR